MMSWMQAEKHRCALPDGPRDDRSRPGDTRDIDGVLEELAPFWKQAEKHRFFSFLGILCGPCVDHGIVSVAPKT